MATRNLSVEQKGQLKKDMKPIAEELREENHKYWTQARLAKEFGVARSTVEGRLSTSNDKVVKASKPYARIKLSEGATEQILHERPTPPVQYSLRCPPCDGSTCDRQSP